MAVIHKYPLVPESEQHVLMPLGAWVLHVAEQRGVICLWAAVEPSAPLALYRVWIVPTGGEVPQGAGFKHVGTVLMSGGEFVFHIYVEGEVLC